MAILARVTAVNPDSHSVDVALLDDGRKLAAVMVLSPSASGTSGSSNLPGTITEDNPVYVMIDYCSQQLPFVLGFWFPQVGQLQFKDNRRIDRHYSDVYSTVDEFGNVELYHPSGVMIAINDTQVHKDLSGQDYDKKWALTKNDDREVFITLMNKGTKIVVGGDNVITITGDVKVYGDVMAKGISLINHVHGNGNAGEDTLGAKIK